MFTDEICKSMHGKRALITGGSKGIGAKIAETFAKVGVYVGIIGRNEADLNTVKIKIESHGSACYIIKADLDEVSQVYAAGDAASKGGLNQLTRTMACEWGPHNIQVNAICPTIIMTDMGHKIWDDPTKDHEVKRKLERIPLHRFGEPEDVAYLALFLASPGADYMNGVSVPLEGVCFRHLSVCPDSFHYGRYWQVNCPKLLVSVDEHIQTHRFPSACGVSSSAPYTPED
jgi:NAD(P)-dependent dehydrogenase (short-subunit alcohol dehydrogenase family)